MLFDFLQDNFVAIIITSFLILFVLTNNNFEKKTNRLFLLAAFSVLVLIIEEAWEARLAMNSTYEPLRVILSIIGYSLRPMVPYVLVIMGKYYSPKSLLLLTSPLLINVLVALSALVCGWAFSYTAENEFVRGPLGVTPFIVAGFYVAVLLTRTIKDCNKGGFSEALIVSAIVLLAFLSTIMESMFGFRFIQNPCIATSITFYYLFLHSNRNNKDALTDALTRRRFYLDAEKYKPSLSAIISLDINDLKVLNDQYGHAEGDRALIGVANIIKKYTGASVSLYRTGGDEFMMLCYKMDEKRVQKLISSIETDLKKTKYRCAIGYVMYSHQTTFDAACQIADQIMYENKRNMKQRISGLKSQSLPI